VALQPCRECGQQVSTEAASCPHCRVPQPTRATAAPSSRALGPSQPRRGLSKLALGCLAGVGESVVILAVGLSSGSDATPSASRTPTPADSVTAAARMCESLVKDKLMSPSAATFAPIPMRRDSTTRAFVGRGEVTAPNPAGVPITHRFVCLIDPDKSAQAVLRDSNPEMCAEVVRLFRL
jgi:hypothetical protein